MSEVVELFEYRGTCLACGTTWTLTPEQIEVARQAKIAYSPCCSQPATLVKRKSKHVEPKHETHL